MAVRDWLLTFRSLTEDNLCLAIQTAPLFWKAEGATMALTRHSSEDDPWLLQRINL